MIIAETVRLQLREITLEDGELLYELMNSEDWLKYIGDKNISSIEDAKAYIQKSYIESYRVNGFGAYVMVRKEDGVAIGTCGLYKRPTLNHPDIGFAMLSKFYKKGYAFEAATAIMNYAQNTLGFKTVLAITIQENKNSAALLNKIGLNQIDIITIEGDDEELLLFSN